MNSSSAERESSYALGEIEEQHHRYCNVLRLQGCAVARVAVEASQLLHLRDLS